MKAQNGVKYQNNYVRAAAFYEATCAPVVENEVEKKAAHEFITTIYRMIEDAAECLGFKTVSDVFFNPWEQQRGREADVKTIRTPLVKIEELMEQLYIFCRQAKLTERGLAVSVSDYTPKKMFIVALSGMSVLSISKTNVELLCEKECAKGLKSLAKKSSEKIVIVDGTENLSKSVFYFSRCMFDDDVKWLSLSFDDMLGAEGKVIRLCEKLYDLDYRSEIILDGRYLSLNYVKEFSKKSESLKKAWADKYHLGIEISYEDLCIAPATLHLRLPRFVEFLSRVDELPIMVKSLIIEKLKNCDGCRYCVQTDKSGTRPLASIFVDNMAKCPYFPSFSLRWNDVNEVLIEQIEAMLESYTIIE